MVDSRSHHTGQFRTFSAKMQAVWQMANLFSRALGHVKEILSCFPVSRGAWLHSSDLNIVDGDERLLSEKSQRPMPQAPARNWAAAPAHTVRGRWQQWLFMCVLWIRSLLLCPHPASSSCPGASAPHPPLTLLTSAPFRAQSSPRRPHPRGRRCPDRGLHGWALKNARGRYA